MKKTGCLLMAIIFIVFSFTGCFSVLKLLNKKETTEPTETTTTVEDYDDYDDDYDEDETVAETGTIRGTLASFEAELLDGGSFTPEDFEDYDITIINFWGTFCGPCLDEMPALEEYRHTLPDNVNFITFCTDGFNNEDTVQSCLDETGLTAPVIIAADGDFSDVLNQIQYIPTTVFINSSGEIVGTEIIGRVDDLPTTFNAHLNEALTMA